MRTFLLLNRDYTPYWKWLAHEFRKLEESKPMAVMLEELVSTNTTKREVELVLKISEHIYQRMINEGIIADKNEYKQLLPLLNAHLQLQDKSS